MGDTATTAECSKEYSGFYETDMTYKGLRIFESMHKKQSYYIELKPGCLDIMCGGDIDKMLELNSQNQNSQK